MRKRRPERAGEGGKARCSLPSKGVYQKNGKTYQRLVTSMGIRDMLLPAPAPNLNATIYCKDEFNKIHAAATVPADYGRRPEDIESKKKERAAAIAADAKMILEMRKAEKAARANINPEDDLALADQNKIDYTLRRAQELRMDQRDEAKTCNKIILETKCQAIRRDQIVEHELIKKEMKRIQDHELDVMMQKLMDDGVAYEEQKRLEQEKKRRYVESVRAQIDENAVRRQMENEIVNEEGRLAREAAYQEMKDMLEESHRKMSRQAEERRQINDYNKNCITFMKKVEEEEDRIEDMKIAEYMREKEERERQMDEEKARIKKEKEKTISELRARQQQAIEDSSAQEELHDQFVKDLVERQWRQKELEEARRRKRMREEMFAACEKQKETKQLMGALQIQREQEDYEATVRSLQQYQQKSRESTDHKKMIADKHRVELMNQINEKEVEKMEEVKRGFLEGKALQTAQDLDLAQLKDHMKKKIQKALARNPNPEYEAEVKRQLAKQKIII